MLALQSFFTLRHPSLIAVLVVKNMKNNVRLLWGGLLGVSLLWWLSDTAVFDKLPTFFAVRDVFLQYSGIIAISVMSIAMLLAVRPVALESALGGLDKMYRLHKWLGISALVVSASHWLMVKGPKWAVGWGWLERRVRGPRPPLPDGLIHSFFAMQRGLAGSVGEWAFYGAAVLMLIALIQWFPYKAFVKTHTVLAATYLALAFHSVVLIKWDYWSTPIGVWVGLLTLGGSASAIWILSGHRKRHRKVSGTVVGVEHFAALHTVSIDIALNQPWPGHRAGQFAFVTLHAEEGAHPYTISSAWHHNDRIRFTIKSLGDYTRTLHHSTQVGDIVKVEGPYGRFTFEGARKRQIWIGGGIGITPFMARMQALAHAPDDRPVDLFHSTAVYDAQVIDTLTSDAKDAGVNLHVLWNERDGRLDAHKIVQKVPQWRDADVWFCGPAGFGQALRNQLVAMGLDARHFHQELFEMR